MSEVIHAFEFTSYCTGREFKLFGKHRDNSINVHCLTTNSNSDLHYSESLLSRPFEKFEKFIQM